jgi:hypothetical protein
MLGDILIERVAAHGIEPSSRRRDWNFLAAVPYAAAPWDFAEWTRR